mgnify:CR=1 FL=1
MKTYTVTITQTAIYDVQAKDEAEAKESVKKLPWDDKATKFSLDITANEVT